VKVAHLAAPALLAAGCAILLAASPAAGATALDRRIEQMVAGSKFSGPRTTAVAVYDRDRGRLLAVYHGRLEMRPASNTKLAISASALGRLGLSARLETRALATGTLTGGVLHGRLWLVGGGDPSFSTVPFSRQAFHGSSGLVHDLAAAVRAAGVRKITGGIWGDESAFNTVRRGPLWKNDSWMDCPPLSALTVNEGWLRFGSFASSPTPAHEAARQLVRALQRQKVVVVTGSHTGVHPGSARQIAVERSPTMHRLVYEMDQVSDNFFAETLTKDLSVAAGHVGSTRTGVALTRRYLHNLGVDLAGARLLDGSGLSKGDRLSARQIVGILRRAGSQPYGWFYRHALPLAGVSGTLEDRMKTGPAHRNALAKTGTLEGASALSGFVTARNGRHLAFSILMNRRHIDVLGAHRLQDRIVQLLAGSNV
jgi:D-alanyl-D-alanine carboxypeptidase/D-alanyl-D-alanine-endopeptidase (penicillin-binding protein 4)